jgi:hypothetical protein
MPPPVADGHASSNPLIPAFRIGITGARHLSIDQLPRLREQVNAFLRVIRDEIARIATAPEAKAAYGADGVAQTRLVAISPLAEGADRLLAEAALEQGFSLFCPLPFPRAEYENDFDSDASKAQYRVLLDRAGEQVLALDGTRGEAQDRSYEAVGRFVVRNCDILVAVWDGQPGKGFGGTTDVVRFAVNHGPPVWWISADSNADPAWLVDGHDFRKAGSERAECDSALRAYLTYLMLPSIVSEPHATSWLERAAHLFQRPTAPPFRAYQAAPANSEQWLWRAHRRLIETMAGTTTPVSGASSSAPPPTPPNAVARYWFNHYRPADAWAGAFARRYRSAYVWIFGLAAIAVIFAAIALVVPPSVPVKLAVTGTELVALVLILVTVLASERQRWHGRFLEYRLFAELCRKQQILALFGWSLQGPSVTEKTAARKPSVDHAPRDQRSWVGWLFGALQRAAPLPQGTFDIDTIRTARDDALRDLIDDQLAYHSARAFQSQRASDRLGQIGELFFIAVLVFVVLKLVLVSLHADHDLILALGLTAAILPALSAGFVGIRSYTELPLLADQSRRMKAEMEAARTRVQQIELSSPLASQLLGSEIFQVATVMLQDIHGWVQLFSAKVVEPG